jgi:hypothetical protein
MLQMSNPSERDAERRDYGRMAVQVLLALAFVAAVAGCGESALEKRRKTTEFIERQLSVPQPILYKDLATQAYEDGGWSDPHMLEDWLRPEEEDPDRLASTLQYRAKRLVWLVETPFPEKVIKARYWLGLESKTGSVKSWTFFTDASGVIRGYTSP